MSISTYVFDPHAQTFLYHVHVIAVLRLIHHVSHTFSLVVLNIDECGAANDAGKEMEYTL